MTEVKQPVEIDVAKIVDITQEKKIEIAIIPVQVIKPSFNPWVEKISEEKAKELFEAAKKIVRPEDFVPEPDPEPVSLKIDKISRNG